jgi:hypothetical protein
VNAIVWKTNCMWTAESGPLRARILYFGERFEWLVYDTRKDGQRATPTGPISEDGQDVGKGDCATLVEAQRAAVAVLGARAKERQ